MDEKITKSELDFAQEFAFKYGSKETVEEVLESFNDTIEEMMCFSF
ncbi:MAG: hypothetical protein MJZ16_05195 [Bacteroidales bacterium]|nr:hypothetical protein [Bacteroidales bacterium]